ncbi:hypothetical protein ACROYT_G030871 [Oculina patagonica]
MEKCKLKVKPTNSEEDKDHWEEFTFPNIPLDELLKYCNPAPFGDIKEMKTVLDPEVRLAYEIESARFKIHRYPGEISIETHIEDKLTPGRYIELVPYKVNVYGEGGFFKQHVDNPSDHNMIGTLVVCLPSPHKGGELLVNHDGLQHVFDSTLETRAEFSGPHFTATAFMNSRVPEDPVSVQEHFECSVESPSLASKALANVNVELEKIQSQRKSSPFKVGFLLKHKYISKGLQPHLLKGEDKTLFDFLVDQQWKCELKSVLSRYQTAAILLVFEDDADSDYEETHEIYEFHVSSKSSKPPRFRTAAIYPNGFGEDGELVETHQIYEFNPVQSFKPILLTYSAPRRRWAQENYHQRRVGIPFIEIYRMARSTEQQLVRNKEGGGGWIGNEVEDVGVEKIYLDSAVIVELCKEL